MAHYNTITSDKNKDVALILCILGGYIGLHQFYVGNIGKGILYFLTMGLCGIGWIIDILKILLGSFRDNSGAPLRATKEQNNAPMNVKIVDQNVNFAEVKVEDNITQIERLAKLKDQGIITEEEFERKKQELLK